MKMDILNPDRVWIENRCYRVLHSKRHENKTYVEEEMYPTQPHEYSRKQDEEEECSSLPIKFENERFWISLPIPGPLIGYVCGKFSANLKRIENSTGAQIKKSSKQSGDGHGKRPRTEISSDFVITADKGPSVAEAYRKLKEIMISGRWRIADYTHFLSVPVNSDSIQEKFIKFKKEVLTKYHSARGIKDATFTHPSKLHLTIAMLTLLDEREKEEAKGVLKSFRPQITKMLGGRRLCLSVKGIEFMNDDDQEVDVLYAKVAEKDGSNVLQVIADMLAEEFTVKNLSPPNELNVKLHVTLMKSRGGQEGRNSFDARDILSDFKEYEFGELDVTEIHISTRHSGHDKYYTPLAIINL